MGAKRENPFDAMITFRLPVAVVKARQLDDPFEADLHGVQIGKTSKGYRTLFVPAKKVAALAASFASTADGEAASAVVLAAMKAACQKTAVLHADDTDDALRVAWAAPQAGGKWMLGPLEWGSCPHGGSDVQRWLWRVGSSPEDDSDADLLWQDDCCFDEEDDA